MNLFRKKKEPSQPAKSEMITFSSDDIPMTRARNIWYALGFANDRFNAIPQIAGYLAQYREWDRMAAEHKVQYLGPASPAPPNASPSTSRPEARSNVR